MMEISELLSKVRKIELKTRQNSNSLFLGEFKSFLKGTGMSFSEVREYQFSDDVKYIDWNVTARAGKPFVKIFEEEKELSIILAVDISASAIFGSIDTLKSDIITEICATIAYSSIQNLDNVALCLFSDQIERYIPPRKGKNHTLRLIKELLNFQEKGGKTNLSNALSFLNNVAPKHSVLFILSDFQDENFEKQLQKIASKNDVIAIQVYDPIELILPNIGLIKVMDPETLEIKMLDTSSLKNRNAYNYEKSQHHEQLKTLFKESKVSHLHISTQEDYIKKIKQFFKQRPR